jgi:hypothetical protein
MKRIVVALLLTLALPAAAQTLTSPLPPGCTAPIISGTTVTCAAAPPVCAPTPPACPATVPPGCAPCTPPPDPPPVSCGTLQQLDLGQFYFDGSTKAIQLGKGDKEVAIMWYVATAADIGKVTHLNVAEHGSGAHYKTIWASRVKCEMTSGTMVSSNSSPSAFVSVDGTQPVNMQVGEKWFFMIRNLSNTGKNTCSESKCGEIISKYLWAPAAGPQSYKAPKFKKPKK